MTNASHTPGPWSVDPNDEWVINEDATGEAIAEVFLRDPDVPEMSERDVANAALIAAAPDLLEALSNIHKWLVDEGLDADLPTDFQAAALAAFDKAGAA